MNAKKTGIITLSKIISTNAKKAHIFDSLHSESIIYLGKICGNDCITILDNIEINIIKYKTLILKVNRNKTYGLWDIPSSRLLRHRSHAIITKDNTKIEMIHYLHERCFSPIQRTFLKAIKMETYLHDHASTIIFFKESTS